jgi:hypothetical protein
MNHISRAPTKNCKHPEDTYGEICVKCNDCGRFNSKCCVCGKILKPDDEVIRVEFYDVFEDYTCPEHLPLFEKHCDSKYEDKYEFSGYKKDFLKLL